jgi:hypothetical protein
VVTKVRKSLSPLLLLLASTVVALPCIANSDINFCSSDNFDTKGRLESHAMIADFWILKGDLFVPKTYFGRVKVQVLLFGRVFARLCSFLLNRHAYMYIK